MSIHPNSLRALEAHRYQPGANGNKGGRPKGLASKIRELDKDGNLVTGLWEIATGVTPGYGARERLRARELLLDRGYGSVAQINLNAELEEATAEDLAIGNDGLLELYDHLKAKPQGNPTPEVNRAT